MSKSQKYSAGRALVTGILALLVMAGGFGLAQTAADPNVLLIGVPTEPASLDPGRDPGGPEQNVLYGVVETLVNFDNDMQLVPVLAAALPEVSEDGTTYTFELRQGITFHDGEPFDAEAVKFTFDRVLGKVDGNPGAYQNLVAGLEDVEIAGPYTVRFQLAQPSATFLTNIAHIQFGIVSPKAVAELGEQFARAPVGTGPYRVERWSQGQEIVLSGHEGYWQEGAPKLQQVIFRVLPDASTRVIALESGQIDAILGVPEVEFGRLDSNPSLQVFNEPTLRTVFYLFQPNQFPMGELAVRQAVSLAIDRVGIAQSVMEGLHEPAVIATFNPTVFGVTGNAPATEFDLDKARAILDEAGWTPGANGVRQREGRTLSFSVWTTTNRYPKDSLITEFVAQTLRSIGMDVKVETLEWAAYRERLYNGELPMLLFGAGSSTGDIDFIASALFNTESRFAQGTNDRIEQLVIEAQTETDIDARLALYDEAFALVHENAFWAPIYWQSTLAAARSNVRDFYIHPTERVVFNSAYKE